MDGVCGTARFAGDTTLRLQKHTQSVSVPRLMALDHLAPVDDELYRNAICADGHLLRRVRLSVVPDRAASGAVSGRGWMAGDERGLDAVADWPADCVLFAYRSDYRHDFRASSQRGRRHSLTLY